MADDPVVTLDGLTMTFAGMDRPALDDLSATIQGGRITGLVGPDGAGKTTLLRLTTGLMRPTAGRITVLGRDTATEAEAIHQLAGYMPQQFGLYEDLSVAENLTLYARLRGVAGAERTETFARLLAFTGLAPFTRRLAGHLSGGMKQKLGLACALLSTPRILFLDEPGVGVDPISRRELWAMVRGLIDQGLAVVWSTAYLDEAEACDHVLLLDQGRLLFQGRPGELTGRVADRVFRIPEVGGGRRRLLARAQNHDGVIDGVIQGRSVRLVLDRAPARPVLDLDGTGHDLAPAAPRFEDAFIDILGGTGGGDSALAATMAPVAEGREIMVEAQGLTRRFGDFTAADRIDFRIRRGEIFGLLGPNGAGKSTTFRMLCGLLPPSDGIARVAGLDLRTAGARARGRIGYMAQKFSLYGTLSVRQNLEFFAGIHGLTGQERRRRIETMIATFALTPYLRTPSESLPLGFKQRLALACAVMHGPAVLFLDEPTSGVDPLTRREFWTHINGLVDKGVTVMVTTHFMDEAEYCDRVALIYRGREIALGAPDDLKEQARSADRPDPSLEEAFIALVAAADQPEAVA